MFPQSAREFARSQAVLAVVTVAAARRAWARMGADFDASWATVGPQLVVLASAAQLGAARAGAAYVPAVLEEAGRASAPLAQVNPRAFVGVAADGRPLRGLLYSAVTTAKVASGVGAASDQALRAGGRWLDVAARTLVADAGRSASGVAIAARPRVGWVRQVNAPSCSRCAILAGRFYRWRDAFKRHPGCDCGMVASTEDMAVGLLPDPKALFSAGQITDLTVAENHAVDLGADLGQVVNARRGASGMRGMTTAEGTTRRGYASHIRREIARQRQGGVAADYRVSRDSRPRPTPEAIYRLATSREDAMQLLQANGYVVA